MDEKQIDFDVKQAEMLELRRLLDSGVEFTVSEVVTERRFPFFKKTVRIVEYSFTVKELTLGVLDRLSLEAIEMDMDENEYPEGNLDYFQIMDVTAKAREMASRHSKRAARCVAIAVLGIECRNKRKLEELTDLFFRSVTPSKLMYLMKLINQMSNLGDFMNSIRWISAARTTRPKRIEEESLA